LFEKYIATKLLATGTIESVKATRACAAERVVEPDVTVAVRVVVDQIALAFFVASDQNSYFAVAVNRRREDLVLIRTVQPNAIVE
jgi:hypothetical protein